MDDGPSEGVFDAQIDSVPSRRWKARARVRVHPSKPREAIKSLGDKMKARGKMPYLIGGLMIAALATIVLTIRTAIRHSRSVVVRERPEEETLGI